MERWMERGKAAGVLAQALLASCAVTAAFLLALAFAMLKLQLDGQKTGIAILACYVLSCFAGGWLCGRKAGRRKFLWGLLTGLAYFLLLFVLSGLEGRTVPVGTVQLASALVLCAGSGMAGGMVS